MRTSILAIGLFGAVSGCSGEGAVAGAQAARAANPLGDAGAPAPDEEAFAGVVTERLDAGGYSYLAIARDDGAAAWVATMGRGAAIGQRVEVEAFAASNDFRSRRLDRRFDRIVFGVLRSDAS